MISAQLRGSERCVAAQVASHFHAVKSHLSSVLTRRTVSLSRPVPSCPVPSPHHESASLQWSAPWKRRWRCCVYLPPGGKKLLPLKSIRGTNYLTSCSPTPQHALPHPIIYDSAECRCARSPKMTSQLCPFQSLYYVNSVFLLSSSRALCFFFLPEQFAFSFSAFTHFITILCPYFDIYTPPKTFCVLNKKMFLEKMNILNK